MCGYSQFLNGAAKKTIIIGHSTGGALALNILATTELERSADALVLFAPGIEYKKKLKGLGGRMMHSLGVSFISEKVENNPFRVKTDVLNFLVQFNHLADRLKENKDVINKNSKTKILVLATIDDMTVNTGETLDFLCPSMNTKMYLIHNNENSKNDEDFNASLSSSLTDCNFEYYIEKEWIHPSHSGITIKPGNKYINNLNHYCEYVTREEIIDRDIGVSANTADHITIKKNCTDNFKAWRGEQDPTKFKTQENKNFNRMMKNVIQPFIDEVLKKKGDSS